MNLAPLANVVAYFDRDPARLARMKQALGDRFDTVWDPATGFLMGTPALRRSVPDGDDLRADGVAFAEGRDTVAARPVSGLSLDSLPGNLGFLRADGDKLVVVRSGPGTVPWYVWRDHERAFVSWWLGQSLLRWENRESACLQVDLPNPGCRPSKALVIDCVTWTRRATQRCLVVGPEHWAPNARSGRYLSQRRPHREPMARTIPTGERSLTGQHRNEYRVVLRPGIPETPQPVIDKHLAVPR